jgi:hypothetical protein
MVDAMERGDWILLPNADQCPAALPDILNPLIEWPAVKLCSGSDLLALRNSCGSLLVAEAPPNADGSAAVVLPHQDSRVFMKVVRAHRSKVCDRLSKSVAQPSSGNMSERCSRLCRSVCGTCGVWSFPEWLDSNSRVG